MRHFLTFRIICAALVGAFLSLSAVSSANAATYNWSFACDLGATACTGDGTLTTAGPGFPSLITSFTGTFGGETINALLPINTFGGNDNTLLSTISPELSSMGISASASGLTFRIFHSSGDQSEVLLGSSIEPGVFSVSAVTLPAALPLFATGLGAIGLLTWRRKRKAGRRRPQLVRILAEIHRKRDQALGRGHQDRGHRAAVTRRLRRGDRIKAPWCGAK